MDRRLDSGTLLGKAHRSSSSAKSDHSLTLVATGSSNVLLHEAKGDFELLFLSSELVEFSNQLHILF